MLAQTEIPSNPEFLTIVKLAEVKPKWQVIQKLLKGKILLC